MDPALHLYIKRY